MCVATRRAILSRAGSLRATFVALQMLDFLFVPAVEHAFAAFHCEPLVLYGPRNQALDSMQYLFVAPELLCDTAAHHAMQAAASVILVLEILVVPIAFLLLVRFGSHHTLLSPATITTVNTTDTATANSVAVDGLVNSSGRRNVADHAAAVATVTVQLPESTPAWRLHVNGGFLSSSFLSPYRYWYILVLIPRRLALIMIATLAPWRSLSLPFFIMAVLFAAVLLQTRFMPYQSKLDNALELLALAVLMIGFQGT